MTQRPLSETDVLAMAIRTAEEDGWDLDEYEQPSLRNVEGRWTGFFDGKLPAPVGKYLTVVIEEQTGETRIVPGR